MKKVLAILAVGMLTISAAEARVYAERTLSWSCPTTRVDGTPFSCATDSAGYDLEVTRPGVAPNIVEISNTSTSRIVTADPNATTYRIRICDVAGACSDWSASAKKPDKPSTVTLTIN